ncbi:MAG: nicotinate (nicotinamide) nucleotide adenylyltransferase [Myxococcota bacterium]
MRIAIYGGSFDPPHVGHLMVASWLRWTNQADAVWLVVSRTHPFGKNSAPYELRLAWVRAAVADLEGVEASDIEGRLPEPSYTIDTLETLAQAHPESTFRFVLGSDLLETVHRWKRWDEVVQHYAPIVVPRAGHQPERVSGPVFPEVSSTDVRSRARRGESIHGLVPHHVVDLVLQHYGSSPGDAGLPPSP